MIRLEPRLVLATWSIVTKFHIAPPENLVKGSMSHDQHGHHAHTWQKKFKNLLKKNRFTNGLKLGVLHQLLEYYQDCSNDDLGLTFTLFFTAWSNMGKSYNIRFHGKFCRFWPKNWYVRLS